MNETESGLIGSSWARFAQLPEDDDCVRMLAQRSHRRRLDQDTSLIEQSDDSQSVYLILSGELKVVWYTQNGHEIWLSDLSAGNITGEYAALCGAPRSSSVVARTPVELAELSAANFRAAMTVSNPFCLRVAELLASRVQATSQQVIGLVGLPLASRLHAELRQRGEPHQTDDECVILAEPPSVSRLAEQIHASREATSRALSALQKRGLVTRQNDAMMVIVPRLAG